MSGQRRGWTHSFTMANCSDCEWTRRYDGIETHEANNVRNAGAKHAQRTAHEVQVERGRVLIYRRPA